ncbi:putative leucine-rich repeat-containing protein DDB_G0290503 [Euwallacea similis]|uniref:putative leucine-rich repeat-containing protein DDB_G0290503 n=1 Tax=Euwallacea similis TaxID=1736056 RepID=UPI00344ECD04
MEEAFSVKGQDFTIIKEKIIKTNDLIVLYKEANDKLTKSKLRANQAIKQLKQENEALTQEVSTLKFHNERLTDNLERCKVDVKELELTNLKNEYATIQKKYQQHLIESQLTITDLQGKVKQCSCDEKLAPWTTTKKITLHDKIRELKLLCNEFKETEQKLKTEINSLNKKNYNLENKILVLSSTKTPRGKDKELATTKAKLQNVEDSLQNAEASLQNHQQIIDSLKQQHSKEISLLQEQLNLLILDNDKLKNLEEKCESLKGELFKLQGREKSDVYTQTENAPIGRCEENSDVDDEDLKGIFSEMICCELMLSPMSRSGQSLSEKVAAVALTTEKVLENEIPNIIITPPTPGIDIKEGSLALHAIMQTPITNAVPPDRCLNEMAIDFGDELRATDEQLKNSITSPVPPEGSLENISNKMSVYFDDDLKIADAELGSQAIFIPKQKSPKRLIKHDRHPKKFWMPYPVNTTLKAKRKNRPRDTILNAIQILQKNNINFTITNKLSYNRLPSVKMEPNPAIKRKKGRPAKLQSYMSDTSDEEVGNYVMKNIRTVSKEFMTRGGSGSETQDIPNPNSDQPYIKSELTNETCSQNFLNTEIFNNTETNTKLHTTDPEMHFPTDWFANSVTKFKKESIFAEENIGSNQPCIKSGLTIETCTQNSPNTDVFNHGLNVTNSNSIDSGTHSLTDWSANLIIKQDALCDDSELKYISNGLVHVPYIKTCPLNGITPNEAKNVTEEKLLNIADHVTNEKTAALDLKDVKAKNSIDVNKLTPPRSPTPLSVVPTVKRWSDRISKMQDKTKFIDNDDLDSLSHKKNNNTTVKCTTPVVKRKRGRPPKIKNVEQLQTNASDRSYEEVCKYVAKNKRIISKEFIIDDESDSDNQQSIDFRKGSVFPEKNANSDQDCIESELTIENCVPNNKVVNETDSSTIDSRTSWSENLIIKQDSLCDNIELKQVSENNFEYFKTKYKEKAKKVAKKYSPQDKLSQTLLDVPKHSVEEDFRGFDDSEKEAANSLRLTVFRQNMKLVRQICEKSNEVNSLNFIKNVQTNENKINIVQDILITKKNAIDLISGTTVANNQRRTSKKSIPSSINVSPDILSQVIEEMSKTGPAQKAGRMFIKPAPVYIPAIYSTPAKRKAEEVEEVLEKSCEGDALFEDCPRSPDDVVVPDQLPKLIPTQKPQQMRVHKVASAINKLLSFGHETALVNEVAMQFAFQTNHFIAQVVVGKISQNCDKPDNSFPPGPPLSSVQRILLGFLIKLENSTHPGVLDKVLELAEPQVFSRLVCTIENAKQLTRFYTAICRMRQDLHRMRRFICDSFYFSGDFAVPVLFTALTMWPNVLPMASQLSEFPLAKVIVHICYLKLCNKPGYNLMPLRDLLSRFYGYPTERWNCDELFQEILVDYIRNPSVKLSDYTLQLFLKNKPASWVSKKVHDCLIPLYQQVPETNPNLKATLLILYGNIHYFFKAQELQFVTKIDEWFEGLQQEEKDPVVQRSLIVARQRLLKCKIGSARKRTKDSEPEKALQVIDKNVDNSKVQ